MIIKDQRAYDKAQRRAMRNQIKKTDDPMSLLKGSRLVDTQRRAEAKFAKVKKLNAAIDNGGTEAIAAAKAKRQMNILWTNPEVSPGEYWSEDQSFADLQLDVKKRYLRVV